MNIIELPLGKVSVNGESYSLVIRCRVYGMSRIEASVLLPQHYPNTSFSSVYRTGVVRIGISFYSSVDSTNLPREGRAKAQALFGGTVNAKVIDVGTFYGVDPGNRDTFDADEQRAFRGIARRALCTLFHYIVETRPAYRDSLVIVFASGSTGSNTSSASYNTKNMRRELVRECGMYAGTNSNNNDRTRADFNNLQRNKALERMYNRAFGFRLMHRAGLCGAFMAVPLRTALEKCLPKKRKVNNM